MKKYISLLLAFSLLFLVSCSVKPLESSEEEKRVVGYIGETEILYEELRFMVLTYKKSLTDSLGDNVFDGEEKANRYREEIREYVYENITFNYAVLSMCRDVGLDSNDDLVSDAVQEEVQKLAKSLGGYKKYQKYLKENFLTDKVFRDNVLVEIMQNELFYVYVYDFGIIESDSDKIYDIIKDEFVRTQHIYVSKSTEGSLDKIRNAYAELCEGADFWATLQKYGEDSALAETGEYITRGYMNEAYENAAYGLSINTYSEIIESDNGYFIVKRLSQDPLYLMVNLDTLSERYQRYAFLNIIYEEQAALEFVPNEYLEGLDLLNLK